MLSTRRWWQELDSGDRITFLRIALWAYCIMGFGGFFLFGPGARLVFFLAVANPLLTLVVARLGFTLIARLANGLVRGLSGGIGDPYAVGFSEQDAMVVRGDWRQAVASYREMLAAHPGHHEARLRMARLLLRNGAATGQVEGHYLQVRKHDTAGAHEHEVANALIDLYRTQHRHDDLRRELAREAMRHEGTPRGDGAKRALQEMADSVA